MPQHVGSTWLYRHWTEDFLPNNQWVAATSDGIVARADSLDDVITTILGRYSLEKVTFAYITFDICQ